MLTAEQKRFARSDAGKWLLRQIDWYFDETDHLPVGNCNVGNICQVIAWGWVDKDGLTEAGRAALEASDEG